MGKTKILAALLFFSMCLTNAAFAGQAAVSEKVNPNPSNSILYITAVKSNDQTVLPGFSMVLMSAIDPLKPDKPFVRTLTTDANGTAQFGGVPHGRYVVALADSWGVVEGSEKTIEVKELIQHETRSFDFLPVRINILVCCQENETIPPVSITIGKVTKVYGPFNRTDDNQFDGGLLTDKIKVHPVITYKGHHAADISHRARPRNYHKRHQLTINMENTLLGEPTQFTFDVHDGWNDAFGPEPE